MIPEVYAEVPEEGFAQLMQVCRQSALATRLYCAEASQKPGEGCHAGGGVQNESLLVRLWRSAARWRTWRPLALTRSRRVRRMLVPAHASAVQHFLIYPVPKSEFPRGAPGLQARATTQGSGRGRRHRALNSGAIV